MRPLSRCRFSILKSRHFPGNSGIERRTVGAATSAMRKEILEQENLGPLRTDIAKWLKGNKTVQRTGTSVGITHAITGKELKALAATMKDLMATPAYATAEVACFEAIMAYFEKDLEPLKRRANAWAMGRVDDLVDPAPPYGGLGDCMDPFSANADLPAMQKLVEDHPGLAFPDMVDMRKKSRQKWLDAAENALSRNATTSSMLAINDIVDKAGLVAQLEAKGHKVEISAPLTNQAVLLHAGASAAPLLSANAPIRRAATPRRHPLIPHPPPRCSRG